MSRDNNWFGRFLDANKNISDEIVSGIITKEHIYDLARDCPLIHHVIMAHEHGNLDWNSALALMVAELSKQNKRILKERMDYLMLAAPPIIKTEAPND